MCVRFGVNAIKTIVLLYGFIAKRNRVNAALGRGMVSLVRMVKYI